MKLVTFNDGRVGRLVDDDVVELDVASTREFFVRAREIGEPAQVFKRAEVRLRAPIVPKKFFHTAGNFREHHEDLVRVDWSHPVNKGIVFFQNVDAIIGPEYESVYPHNLAMELRVNGDIRQKSNTSRMSVSIPQLVAYHSPQVYSAGDLITTGTIAGVAASTDDPFANYLKPGDLVEAEIEGLGVLRNQVVSWQDAYGVPAPPAEQWV